jgi:hypothetical protein
MAKKPEEKKTLLPPSPKERVRGEVAIVKVKALRNINTTLYGVIKEGKEAELPAEFAEQLSNAGDCTIVE